MPKKNDTKPDGAREQIHDLSAGFREVAELLGVPAGIPDDDDERDLVDPEEVRDSILDAPLTESATDNEEFIA